MRRKNVGLMVVGFIIVFIIASTVVKQIAECQKNLTMVRLAPAWLLFHTLNDGGADAGAAEEELVYRYDAGTLDHNQVLAEIQKLSLKTPRARIISLVDNGNLFLEAAAVHGDLPPAQWNAYCEKLCKLNLLARDKVRRGAPIKITAGGDIQMGSYLGSCYELQTGGVKLDIDGIPCDAHSLGSMSRASQFGEQGGGCGWVTLKAIAPATLDSLSTGMHTIHLTMTCNVAITPGRNGSATSVFNRDVSAVVEIVSPDAPTVTLLHGKELAGQIRRAIVSACVSAQSSSAKLDFNYVQMPCWLVCRVLLRSQGKEWKIDSKNRAVVFYPGTSGMGIQGVGLKGFDCDLVDVILRPDIDSAEAAGNFSSIWGEDIVIPNVRVDRTGAH
jgi:hypothetical protein